MTKPRKSFGICCGLERPIEKHFILFFHFVSRVRQTMGKCTVVGKED